MNSYFPNTINTVEVLCKDGTTLSARLHRPVFTRMFVEEDRANVAQWDIHVEMNAYASILITSASSFGGVQAVTFKHI